MAQRNAQGYVFGLGSVRAAAAGTLTGTLQIASLLQDLSLQISVAGGLVTAIRVAGQNILVSNVGCDVNMWAPNCQLEGHRSLGIPLDAQQQVAIDYTLSGAGNASGGIGSDPIAPQQVIPVNSLGPALDYACGLGTVAAPAGAWTFSATILRPVHLGRMVLTAAVADDLTVRSVTVNNIELMSGAAGAVGECAIEVFAHTATDVDGLTLDYFARANDIVTISGNNYNVGAQRVDGGIFVLPPPTAGS